LHQPSINIAIGNFYRDHYTEEPLQVKKRPEEENKQK